MIRQRANVEVVFTGAAWFSGSTLLGMTLGAHPSVFYAGEANKTRCVDDVTAPLKKRVCRVCGPGCSVWHGLQVNAGEDLYEVLSRRTRRPIVFDSTKQISWITSQVAALRDVVPVRLIVLTRDGRAVMNSRRRKVPEIPARELATFWAGQMRNVEELAAQFPGPVHRLAYEELASRPAPALRAVANFVGVGFDPRMLDPWSSDQHPLGGNDGPLLLLHRERARRMVAGVLTPDEPTRDWYAAHPAGIVLDDRWRHELGATELAVFEEVAGETNRAYAWEGRDG